MEKLLVKYHEDFGRMGSLDGLFICTKTQLESIKNLDIYFGEVLGKHSEIISDEAYKHCEIVQTKDGDIEVLERLLGEGTISGFNPLDYTEECEYQYIQGEEECGNEDCDWCFGETDE